MANPSLAVTARRALLRQGRAILDRHRAESSRGGDLLAAMSEVERQQLEEIHAALERIERGVYGRCERCLERLERDRVEAMPWVRCCDQCAAAADPEAPGAPEVGVEPGAARR
jgi:RNA polymerase-binding transcription factor DksA